MIQFFPVPALLGAGLLVLGLLGWLRRDPAPLRALPAALFGAYLLALAAVTLFPIPWQGGWQGAGFVLARINLIPFHYRVHSPAELGLVGREVVGNILMTVPFGFGLQLLGRLPARRLMWLGLALGLGIESAQLAVSLAGAGAYRTVDITDVILNTAGVLLGGLLHAVIVQAARRARGRRADHHPSPDGSSPSSG